MTRMPAAQRREALAHAALRVIAERGVEGATTRSIVAEAGMSLASFHYAYRSRDELLGTLVDAVVAQQSAAVAAVIDADLRGSVRRALQAYLDGLIADPAAERALLELMHYAQRTPALRSRVGEQWSVYRASARHLAEHAAAAAGATWRVPVEQVAHLIITITDGITLGWLADRDDAAASRTLDLAADALTALADLPETPR